MRRWWRKKNPEAQKVINIPAWPSCLVNPCQEVSLLPPAFVLTCLNGGPIPRDPRPSMPLGLSDNGPPAPSQSWLGAENAATRFSSSPPLWSCSWAPCGSNYLLPRYMSSSLCEHWENICGRFLKCVSIPYSGLCKWHFSSTNSFVSLFFFLEPHLQHKEVLRLGVE